MALSPSSALTSTRPWSRRSRQIGWSLVAAGAVLRVVAWVDGRSLWRDEASLVFNLVHRRLADSTGHLDLDQAAPIGFLSTMHAVIRGLGSSEAALRLVPLFAGIALLAVALLLTRRHLDAPSGLLAVGLLAFAPRLIYYSSEVKQYSSDALAVVVILLVVSVAHERRYRGTAFVGLIALGVIPWFSFPAAFVLVGVGLVLAVEAIRRPGREGLTRLVVVGGSWLASVGLLWAVQARTLGHNPDLDLYWQEGFLPIPPRNGAGVDAWVSSLKDLSSQASVSLIAAVTLVAAIGGAVVLARRSIGLAGVLVAPLAVAIVVSSLRLYPFTGRVALWTVPILVLLMAVGITAAWRAAVIDARLGRRRWIAVVAIGVLLVPVLVSGIRAGLDPPGVEEVGPVARRVEAQLQPGDLVLVDHYSWESWIYYTGSESDLPFDGVDVEKVGGPAPTLSERVDGRSGRVWVVSSGWMDGDRVGDTLMDPLQQIASPVEEIRAPGVRARLYDLP